MYPADRLLHNKGGNRLCLFNIFLLMTVSIFRRAWIQAFLFIKSQSGCGEQTLPLPERSGGTGFVLPGKLTLWQNAPFSDKEDFPYLRLKAVTEEDGVTLSNAVVLRPNCCARIEVLNNPDDYSALRKRASDHSFADLYKHMRFWLLLAQKIEISRTQESVRCRGNDPIFP